MKREYGMLEENKQDHSSNTTTTSSFRSNMFGSTKLQQHQQQHHHQNYQNQNPFPQPTQTFHHNPFTQQEVDSTQHHHHHMSPPDKQHETLTLTPQPVSTIPPPPSSDGATIEVVRRPRGRPPGSKNKAKPPVIITRDAEPSMSPYILEIPLGVDIISSITKFCRKRNMGLCVLNGSGTVTNVTLRQPSTTPVSTVTFHGRFDILSISATIIVQQNGSQVPTNNGIANGFTISLAGPQGQVVGGGVVGPLVTAGTVYLIAATFNSPSYHKLPVDDVETTTTTTTRNNNNSSGGGGNESGGGGGHQSSPPPQTVVSGGGDSGHPPATTGAQESCGMSMYSCHLPSDVIWTPTARQPPPPPY